MKKDGMYGPPCIAPSGAIVLRTVWTYYVKWDGTLKSRSCCDGSVLKGRGIAYAQHYTACISQPGMMILWDMVAIRGWIAIGADAINALAQADPPKEPSCALTIKWQNGWRKSRGRDQIEPSFFRSYVLYKVTPPPVAPGMTR
jgi:hypothetical protein